jgi:hypothetical protein
MMSDATPIDRVLTCFSTHWPLRNSYRRSSRGGGGTTGTGNGFVGGGNVALDISIPRFPDYGSGGRTDGVRNTHAMRVWRRRALVAAISAFAVFWLWLVFAHPNLTLADSRQIRAGMAFDEVVQAFGVSHWGQVGKPKPNSMSMDIWLASDGLIFVNCDADGRVLSVDSRPESRWKMLQLRVSWQRD